MSKRSMSKHAIARFVRNVKRGRNALRSVFTSNWRYHDTVTDDINERTGFIAGGGFNEVYSYGKNKVIRISKRSNADTSWDFLEWAQLEPQPWMPTVYQLGEVWIDDRAYKYAVLERLDSIDWDEHSTALEALREGEQHYKERFGFLPLDLFPSNIMRRKTGEYVMNDPM